MLPAVSVAMNTRYGTVAAKVAAGLIRALVSAGAHEAELMRALAIAPELLADPEGRVPYAITVAAWREAARMLGDHALGLRIAALIQPGVFDVVNYAARSSPTLGEAYQRVARYHGILNDGTALRFEEGCDGTFRLTYTVLDPVGGVGHYGEEFSLANFVRQGRALTGVEWLPVRVDFTFAAPADARAHRAYFGAPVSFGQPTAALVLSRATADLPLVTADAALCQVLDRHAEELLQRTPRHGDFTERVRGAICNAMRGGDPSIEAVARAVCCPPRSLQRRLQRDGTSFQRLLDDLRRDLALRYIEDARVGLSEIAFLLGFSEASVFHRAFKRWTGSTPTEYRRRMTG
jgi:AraC-like DNA-binding protein